MRLADDKKIQQKMRPRPGGSPLAVFNPEDVERVASERAAADARPFVMPPAAAVSGPAQDRIVDLLNAMLDRLESMPLAIAAPAPAAIEAPAGKRPKRKPAPVPVWEKAELSMPEAVSLGYVRDNLRDAVKAGKLPNIGTQHRYRFRRRDLDTL